MNALYLQQLRQLISSFSTILFLMMTLFIIAQSAAFLSLTLESGLSAKQFFEFVAFQVPVQATTLVPLALLASSAATFRSIHLAGEHTVLRAAGIANSSFFSPAWLVGAALALIYIPLAFELSPWAARNLERIEMGSLEQAAQNTLINAGEPTDVSTAEVFVQSTNNTTLDNISIYGKGGDSEALFITANRAEFIQGPSGLALTLQGGLILRSVEDQPHDVTRFDRLLVNLASLLRPAIDLSPSRDVASLSFHDLDPANIKQQAEAGRRLATVTLILAIPVWIMFWQLRDGLARSGGFSRAVIGVISMIPLFLVLQSDGIFSALGIYAMAGLFLVLALSGPVWELAQGFARHTKGLRDASV